MREKRVSRTSEKTRQAIIAVAVKCLAAEGYHRATSNRIAREAGLTWGVIQYHFGDRDGIYQAVLDSIIDAYVIEFDHVALKSHGKSVAERLKLLVDSVWHLLNEPAYIATMELLINLARDPGSRIDTESYVLCWSQRMAVLWHKIFPEYPEGSASSDNARQIFFAALRGFIDNQLIGQWKSGHDQSGLNDALVKACGVLLEPRTGK